MMGFPALPPDDRGLPEPFPGDSETRVTCTFGFQQTAGYWGRGWGTVSDRALGEPSTDHGLIEDEPPENLIPHRTPIGVRRIKPRTDKSRKARRIARDSRKRNRR